MFPNFAVMRRSISCAGRLFMRVVVSSLSLSPWIPTFAQDAQQAAPAQTVELPVISVTVPPASKPTNQAPGNSVVVSPTTLPTPTTENASSVTVITGAEMEAKQQRTVPDALADVPGLNVVQTGGPGGQTSVFIRGTNSNEVKVLIDGIDVSDPSNPNGSFDFGQLFTGDIARIEVLRGPQSGLYGSDAIGGVISVTTKNGEGPPKVTATVDGGSFGTFNQKASLSGSQDIFNYVFNIQHFQSTDTPVTPLNQLAPGEQKSTTLTTIGHIRRNLAQSDRQFRGQFGGQIYGLDTWIAPVKTMLISFLRARGAAEHAGEPSILRARRSRLVAVRWPVQELLRRELHQCMELDVGPKSRQLYSAASSSPADDESRAAHPV